jgi:P27 family predicted phage terminase small subunit
MSFPPLSRDVQKMKGERFTRAVEKPIVSEAGRPRLPRHLCPEAVLAWREAVRLLRKRGTLTAGDAPTLEVFAETKARWIQAKKDLAERGLQITYTVLDKNGQAHEREKTNPNLKIAEFAEKQLLALAKALGLSPDSREKIKPPKTPKKKEPPKPGTWGFLKAQQKLEKQKAPEVQQ